MKNMLFYFLVLFTKQSVHSWECKSWISSVDGKYRSHCYQYHPNAFNNTFEAEAHCKRFGGHLAPYIDEEQFQLWKNIISDGDRMEVIIGVTDLLQEGHWRTFDGTSVYNPPWNKGQPNGGRSQNCVVINAGRSNYGDWENFKLQDKACSETFEGLLCYTDEMCIVQTRTTCYVEGDCFWFIKSKDVWNFYEANSQCREQDGVLTPITSLHQLHFLQDAFAIFSQHTGSSNTWLGVHLIENQILNVNGEDFPQNVVSSDQMMPDKCLLLEYRNISDVHAIPVAMAFHSCDIVNSNTGICTKSRRGQHWYTERNTTSKERLKALLQINKTQTSVHLSKSTSAFDGRISSKRIGVVGIAVIVAVILSIAFLDFGVHHKNISKKKRKPTYKSRHGQRRCTGKKTSRRNQIQASTKQYNIERRK